MSRTHRITKTFVFIVLAIFLLSSGLVIVTFLSPASVTTETSPSIQEQDFAISKQHQDKTGHALVTGNGSN